MRAALLPLLLAACSGSPRSEIHTPPRSAAPPIVDASLPIAAVSDASSPRQAEPADESCKKSVLTVGAAPLGYRAEGLQCDTGRQGMWRFTFLDGALHREGPYEDNLEEGEWSLYYHSGALQSRGAYSGGRRQGPWKRWHENGVLSLEGSYEQGLRQGQWKRWHDSGQLYEDRIYERGNREGMHRKWNAEGELSLVRECKDDQCTVLCRISKTTICTDPLAPSATTPAL